MHRVGSTARAAVGGYEFEEIRELVEQHLSNLERDGVVERHDGADEVMYKVRNKGCLEFVSEGMLWRVSGAGAACNWRRLQRAFEPLRGTPWQRYDAAQGIVFDYGIDGTVEIEIDLALRRGSTDWMEWSRLQRR